MKRLAEKVSDRAALAWLTESRLVSLREIVEEFYANRFHTLGWILGYSQGFGDYGGGTEDEPIERSNLESFLRQMRDAKKDCEKINLRVCAIHFEEVISDLESGKPISHRQLASVSRELRDSVNREMKTTKFFRLSPDTQSYFQIADGFGKQVSEAFPSADYDIKEPGNCLALSRATACVYHAMRVLEHGLCALADRFNVPFEHKSWNDVIEPIEKAIRQIKNQPNKSPNWKDEEQFYSEAASQFMHFKNAWRNYTAHIQFKYTEGEAEVIYRHVRDFMRHIAKQLKEKKATP